MSRHAPGLRVNIHASTTDIDAPVTSASIAKDEFAANQRNVRRTDSKIKSLDIFNRGRSVAIVSNPDRSQQTKNARTREDGNQHVERVTEVPSAEVISNASGVAIASSMPSADAPTFC